MLRYRELKKSALLSFATKQFNAYDNEPYYPQSTFTKQLKINKDLKLHFGLWTIHKTALLFSTPP